MRNASKKAYEAVLKYTAEHELTVLHDDGLYRHLRINTPGTVSDLLVFETETPGLGLVVQDVVEGAPRLLTVVNEEYPRTLNMHIRMICRFQKARS